MPRRTKTSSRPRLDRVLVEGDLRDEVDWDRFAWALLQYARILSENEDAKENDGS
jgi:hypothetical protein